MKGLFTFFSMAVLLGVMLITPASLLANNTGTVKDVVIYYNIDEQPLNQLSSWNSAPDGSGDAPISFDTDNTVWQIIHDATLSDQWTITGENAKVLVGNQMDEVSFIIIGNGNLDAVVDITNQGYLVLIGKNYPDFGEFASGSTVVFSFGLHTIPYHDYYNLTFAGITPAFNGNGTIRIRGVMELTGNVVFPDARGGNEYSFEFYGPDIQFITTGGNVLRSYNFTAEKTQGSLRLAENSVVSADNQVRLNFTDNATFRDSGNTIYAGNSVNIDGSPNAYNFTGTLILAGTEPDIVNGAGAGNNFNLRNNSDEDGPVVAPLHNIVVRAANTGGQFSFRGAEGSVFSIKGDLIIESQADGRVRFYDNQVRIEGDFIIEEGFAGTIDAFERLGFVGGDPQQVHPGIRIETAILDVDNAIHVDGGILYTSQLVNLENWVSTTPEGIFAISTSTIINDDPEETPYFLGNLGYYIASSEPQQLFFRVGNQTDLLPLLVSLTQEDTSEVLYYTRVADHPLPNLEIPSDIEVILDDYFYFFHWDGNANIESLSVSIPFWLPENDHDTDLLRMVKSSGSQWVNLGGSFTGSYVEASIPTDEGGFLALGQQLISSSKSITYFAFEGLEPVVAGMINEDEKTITLEVPFGTVVETLTPTIEHTGVSISPQSGVEQDFSVPVEYTVTAEDESIAVYTVTVAVLPSLIPSKLQITDLNNGEDIFAGNPFSLTFQLLNIADEVVNATEDIVVAVSLASGTGILSGTLLGTVSGGTSETTITGILYDTAESGVSLMISAGDLENATTELFEVLAIEYDLVLNVNLAEASDVMGAGSYVEGELITLSATANEGFVFVNWTDEGINGQEISSSETFDFVMPAQNTSLSANFQKILSLEGLAILNKVYDGTTDATISNDGILVGVLDDKPGVSLDTSGAEASFDTKDVAEDKPVAITGLKLTGSDALYYFLESPQTSTASISPASLTLGGSFTVEDKTWDNSAAATMDENNLTLVTPVEEDGIELTDISLAFAQSNPGTDIEVSITGATLTGTDAHNYSLSLVGSPTSTANITPKDFLLTIEMVGEGQLNVDGVPYTAPISVGNTTTVTLEATETDGYTFQSWGTADGTILSNDNPFEYVMPAQDVTLTAFFDIIDGVQVQLFAENIGMFPNPAQNRVTFRSENTPIKQIQIADITGKVVYRSESIHESEYQVSVSAFYPGLYFATIITEKDRPLIKLQITR